MSKQSSSLLLSLTFTITLLATVCLVGCNGNQGQKADSLRLESQPSPWKMTLNTEPAHPKYGEETTFRVTMQDKAGNPVPGAKVEADLKMKSHDMGKNVVLLADNGQGVYEGRGKFSMAGPWDVVVVASKEGTTGMQTFNVVARKE